MKKILIVEQNPRSSLALKASVETGYRLIEATSTEGAVELVRAQRPDLVLLDMEGFEKGVHDLVADLRDAAQTKYLPIILLSDKKQKKDTALGLCAGADDYMTKPVNMHELVTRIDTHLRTKNYYSDLDKKDLLMLLELTEVVSVIRNPKRILKIIVDKMVPVINASRCSVISLNDEGELVVLASSDLVAGQEVRLELRKYPEIERALVTQRPVVLQNISNSPIMEPVKDAIKGMTDKAIFVVPIIKKQNVIGTFFLRTASPLQGGITERVFKLCQIVANTTGNALENAILFEAMQNSKEILEEKAIRDSLTKLYNHQYFHSRFEEEFSRAQRYGQALSCVFVDLDNFKSVNDRFGHITGDVVLKQIGRMIKKMLRKSDIAARYGGEEFAVLLPNTNYEGASEFAERLISQVRELHIAQLKGQSVTVSIGIAMYQQDNVASYEELLQCADQAMYQAKQSGKDRVSLAVNAA